MTTDEVATNADETAPSLEVEGGDISSTPADRDLSLEVPTAVDGAASVAQIASAPHRIFRPPKPGQVIDSGRSLYVIGSPLGNGAYGTTYECTDSWDNRQAVKVLLPVGGTYDSVRLRFEREVVSLVRLRHPHITFVYDAFEFEDTFYIVMERCAGNLRALFEIPDYHGVVWLMPVARCLLQGVAYLHEQGIVHRDIHLGNVLYSFGRDELLPGSSESLTFKLADLGVSRFETEQDFTTASLAPWMLPPEILSPEEFGAAARQMDVYHCALLLLAVVSGKEPTFTRDQILAGGPRLAAEALGEPCGPPLARALRRHVTSRTPSPQAFWKDLQQSGCRMPQDPLPLPESGS